MEDLMSFDIPQSGDSIIKVIGVGGGGSNAVNHMFNQGIKDVSFVVCNTDSQALLNSPIPVKVQLGESLTEGRGAGSKPVVGRESAIENLNDIIKVLEKNTKMVFITAGMGGGTGTGAAPIIAKAAREMGILTVGIVTIPFRFEGKVRINQALDGIAEMEKSVDSLLIINNERLREMYGDLKLSNAFAKADNVLTTAAKGIAEIITVHGYVNVDFADVETVMRGSGVAIMGSASAEGDHRAIDAIQAALESPLLNNNDISGAKNILLNVTSGADEITMDEVGEITDYVQELVGTNASIIWGTGIDDSLGSKVNVTIIATGFASHDITEVQASAPVKEKFELRDHHYHPAHDSHVTSVEAPRSSAPIGSEAPIRVIDFGEMERSKGDLYDKYYPTTPGRKVEPQEPPVYAPPAEPMPQSYNSPSRRDEMDDERMLEQLENTPAYKRRNMRIENPTRIAEGDRISRFSLMDDGTGPRISKDNPYLHDNVD
jgi:cell division protein FtsZ